MFIKEISVVWREKFVNPKFWNVVWYALLAKFCESFGQMDSRKRLIETAREHYWVYIQERHKEFEIALHQWDGPSEFVFMVQRYTARNQSEIRRIAIKAVSMHEALARLLSYNHGPGFFIVSRTSNAYDQGIWAEITNSNEKFLPPELAAAAKEEFSKPPGFLKKLLLNADKVNVPIPPAVVTVPEQGARMMLTENPLKTKQAIVNSASESLSDDKPLPLLEPSVIDEKLQSQLAELGQAVVSPPPKGETISLPPGGKGEAFKRIMTQAPLNPPPDPPPEA